MIRSLQDAADEDSDVSDKQSRRFRSPSSQFDHTSTSKYKQNGLCRDDDQDINGDEKSPIGSEDICGSTESVSSTGDLLVEANLQTSLIMVNKSEKGNHAADDQKKGYWRSRLMISFIFLLFATICCFVWINDAFINDGEGYNLVPT